MPEFLTSKEAAEYLAVSEGSLRSMRSCGYGPPFHRQKRAVRYRVNDLDDYVASLDNAATARRSNRLNRMKKGDALTD